MPTRTWPETAMVGYIDCAAIGAVREVTKAQVQSYNVVIFGFANADGSIPTSPPYQDFINEVVRIKQWESPNTINLLSVGGAVGQINISPSQVDQTVQKLMRSIAELDLDGIDLDIEDPSLPISDILSFAQKLRVELDKQDCFLTCAPILAGSNEHPTLNTPAGPSWEPVYGPDGVVFDAILVQAYNSGPSFVYTDPATNDLIGENNPNIVRAAYSALYERGNINPKSRIIIGVPCDQTSANIQSNCWNPNYTIGQTAQTLVDNVIEIKRGAFNIQPQGFGGLMTWSISNDAYFSNPKGYFSDTVARYVLELNTQKARQNLLNA